MPDPQKLTELCLKPDECPTKDFAGKITGELSYPKIPICGPDTVRHTMCGKTIEFKLIIYREKIFENLEWKLKKDNCYELWGTPTDTLTTECFDVSEIPMH